MRYHEIKKSRAVEKVEKSRRKSKVLPEIWYIYLLLQRIFFEACLLII